ncbi:MAG TPA: ABC transporter ATP-binding protein [Chitinophagaceae bacterium]|nr:ABC transporter ATP-binding protein [Chitinophagaceae bacterium]
MKEKLKHIFLILTPSEKRQFWIQVVLNIFISIADIATLAFLLLVINFYINNPDPTAIGFLPEWMLSPGSVTLIAVFFILFSIKNFLGILISNSQYKFIGQVALRISKQKLDNYLHGSFHGFVNTDSSEHIRKIAFQPFEFSQHILSGMQQILIQAVLILLTIAEILLYNAGLFLLLLLILLPPVTFVFFYIRKRLAASKKNIQLSNEKSFQYLLDALKGYVEGNIYQRNDFFFKRFSSARQVFSNYLFHSLSVQTMPSRIIETFAVLGLFILIVIARWSDVNDSSTLITIGAFMAAAYKIIPGIVKIINAAGQMRSHGFPLSELESAVKGTKDSDSLSELQSIQALQLKKLSFQYGDVEVLKNFSLSVVKGDFVGVTGKSGKGKTTILNLLLGFLQPATGEILVNDRPVSASELKNFWPQISYVRQQPFLLHDSILRNITLQEENYDKEKLEFALDMSGLKDFIYQSAEGLDKMITENGKNISGGQQQRIAIARALYKNADLILLDEPFNELDETSAILLMQHFKNMTATGKTVIMITHDIKCLSYCSNVISLDDKR